MLFILSQAWDKKNYVFYLTIVVIVDMLPGIMGNQENIMATGNPGPKILSERSSHNDSAVQVVQVHNFYV